MNNLEMNTLEKTEEVRELSTVEVEDVAGGFIPLIIVAAALLAYNKHRADNTAACGCPLT
jgi:hypothetical protein